MELDMPLAWIPPGRFLMGGTVHDNEKPQRLVEITQGFWMGVTPVTQKQFEGVMGYNASNFKGDNRPVEMVSWHDAIEFCKKLSELTSRVVRLPTEAEWEYACRAGEGGDYYSGNGDEALKAVGWYDANSNKQTQPVMQKKPNKWGLYDMHGNVWEWCADWYDETYYKKNENTDPKGPSSGEYRLLRGGSWGNDSTYCRSAYRYWFSPVVRYDNFGFRVLLNSVEQE